MTLDIEYKKQSGGLQTHSKAGPHPHELPSQVKWNIGINIHNMYSYYLYTMLSG